MQLLKERNWFWYMVSFCLLFLDLMMELDVPNQHQIGTVNRIGNFLVPKHNLGIEGHVTFQCLIQMLWPRGFPAPHLYLFLQLTTYTLLYIVFKFQFTMND